MFSISNPVKLHFGVGSVNKVGKEAIKLGNKALIVTGQSSARKYGILQKVMDLLEEKGVDSIPFEKVSPNPLSTTVDEGVDTVKQEDCDLIIGLGGGSPMDTAKAIALTAVNQGTITDYQPGGKYADSNPEKTMPMILITTTAGTGSEINSTMVITNAENQEKPGIGFDSTYPDVGIVDPELMTTVPREITIDTGVDVLFHALEAYLSTGSSRFTDMLSKEAIRLTVDNLQQAVEEGNNLQARTNMAWANTLAGWAIDLGGTVVIHGCGHPLSGHYNITHGQTLSALGVSYLKQNHQANPGKFAELSKLLGYEPGDLSTEELAAKSPTALANFLDTVDRNIRIKDLVDIEEGDIEKLVKDTFKTMKGTVDNNPRPLSEEDIEQLYREALN